MALNKVCCFQDSQQIFWFSTERSESHQTKTVGTHLYWSGAQKFCKVFFLQFAKLFLLFVNRTKAFWSSRSNWGIGCQRMKDNVKIHTVLTRCILQQDYVFDEFLPTNLSDFNFCGLTNITQILDLAWVATTDKYIGFWVIFFLFLVFSAFNNLTKFIKTFIFSPFALTKRYSYLLELILWMCPLIYVFWLI